MIRALVTAVRTLTSVYIPGTDTGKPANSLPWFPFVGLLLGLVSFGAAILTGALSRSWPGGTALVLVVTGVLLTRGLHLDGLADFADAFWGGRSRERVLEIMKDTRLGAFGVIALACILLAKWVCLTRLVEAGTASWIIPAFVISRFAQAALAALNPYARNDGGTGERFVSDAGAPHLLLSLLSSMAILLLIGCFDTAWLTALAGGFLLVILLGAYFRARIGGVTGDLLGAGSELVEVAVLALGALGLAS